MKTLNGKSPLNPVRPVQSQGSSSPSDAQAPDSFDADFVPPVGYDFGLSRRAFGHVLGLGILIAVSPASAQGRRKAGGEGTQNRNVAARIHIGHDGVITVLTGK